MGTLRSTLLVYLSLLGELLVIANDGLDDPRSTDAIGIHHHLQAAKRSNLEADCSKKKMCGYSRTLISVMPDKIAAVTSM